MIILVYTPTTDESPRIETFTNQQHCCDALAEAVANMPRGDDLRFYPPERNGRYIAVSDGFHLDFCPFCSADVKVPADIAANECLGNDSCLCSNHHKGRHCCSMMEGTVSRGNITFHRRRKTLPKYVLPRTKTPINFCPWCKNTL